MWFGVAVLPFSMLDGYSVAVGISSFSYPVDF
jgi:hypothetical protein